MTIYKNILPLLLIAVVLVIATTATLFAAKFVEGSASAQSVILELGYGGVILMAIIAGTNVIVPIPAATLTPLFVSAGLVLPWIIISLTVGTLIADFIGYLFGQWSRVHIFKNYPRTVAYIKKIYVAHPGLIIPLVFLYAAFVPLPNEVLIIPLALLSVRWRLMMVPLFFGDLINQTIYAYGIDTVYGWLF
jgi:membrane protein DedA with SNARE-associated domain